MKVPNTAEVIRRFNHAFVHHDPADFGALIGEACVMEAVQPAPDGARYEGREACLGFWLALINDRHSQFEPEDVVVHGDHATIRWRYRFGPGPNDYVRGVTLMTVSNGVVVEALGYTKVSTASPQLDQLVSA